MEQIIAYLKLFLAIVPLIVQAIQVVEAAIPAPGAGAQKLEMIKQMLQTSVNIAPQIGATFEQLWPTIQSIIANTVAAFNATGMFKKS